ncbi:MAG: Na+/H+ antiporter subunit E [Pirellulaceae bacterium]|nr:Na+/H+ antiporter subunit E [Pirellulaceae bacterium]
MDSSHHDQRTWQQRWLPHPLISIGLIYLWMALQNNFAISSLVTGVILGIVIPIQTRSIWDVKPHIGAVGPMIMFAVVLLWDIVVANVQVALIVVFKPLDRLQPKWFTVPLDLVSPEAIAILSSAITLTPGTVSCDLSANGRSLLIHAMDTGDAEAEAAKIKQRYEARLMRIFE